MHADDADKRRAEELPVAQHSGCMLRPVLKGDSHCPIDLSAQLAAIVLERLRQRWNFGWPAADFAEQGSDEAVPRWAWDANTICQGWILEHDGARWARARDSSTNARGTDSGKNIRVE